MTLHILPTLLCTSSMYYVFLPECTYSIAHHHHPAFMEDNYLKKDLFQSFLLLIKLLGFMKGLLSVL